MSKFKATSTLISGSKKSKSGKLSLIFGQRKFKSGHPRLKFGRDKSKSVLYGKITSEVISKACLLSTVAPLPIYAFTLFV